MDYPMIQSLLSGAGGAGAALLIGLLLLRKTLQDLSERIDRTDRALQETRQLCDRRMEAGTVEYKQIMDSLNEIKVQIARSEAIQSLRNHWMDRFFQNLSRKP